MCKALITPDARAVSSNGHLSLRQISIGSMTVYVVMDFVLNFPNVSFSDSSLPQFNLYRSRNQILRMFQPVPTRDSPARCNKIPLFSFPCFQLFRYQSIDTSSISLFFRKRLRKSLSEKDFSRKILRFLKQTEIILKIICNIFSINILINVILYILHYIVTI